MADTSCKIAVLVVNGNYSALRALGFPLLALAAMQEGCSTWSGLLGCEAVNFRDICELFLAEITSDSAEQHPDH